MSGGAFVTIKVGRAGAAADHARYITRERATEGKQQRVWTRNVPDYAAHPDHAERGMSYKERTADLREYARQLEEDELERPQRGAGEKRTHYRAIYSFDREVTDEKARELVDSHLQENFPQARTIAAIHRDTDNAHVHVQIAARGADDKKLHFDSRTHRRLDERWARIYGQEFGREIEKEHLAKKAEWREWMREARAARDRGGDVPPRPQRAARERNQVEERRRMHAAQYGLKYAEQTGIRDDQRRAISGEQRATARAERADRPPRRVDGELAADRGATRSSSQPNTAERTQPADRQPPRRSSRTDRAVSHRTQTDDRTREARDHRGEQARADSQRPDGQKRASEPRVSEPDQPGGAAGERGRTTGREFEPVAGALAGTAQNHHAEGNGRDVREHDSRGSYHRVLRLMETVTDTDAARGRDEVAGLDGADATRTSAAARTADRKQIVQPRAAGADRSADERREFFASDRAESNITGGIIADAKSVSQQTVSKVAEKIEPAVEPPRPDPRTEAGRARAQYLMELAQISLQERATGQNAYTERQQLQRTMRGMWQAEAQHERQYGGKPRPILTKEERDYLVQRLPAMDGHAHSEIKKELNQAYIIGEARAGERLEKEPERERERVRDRGGFGFSR